MFCTISLLLPYIGKNDEIYLLTSKYGIVDISTQEVRNEEIWRISSNRRNFDHAIHLAQDIITLKPKKCIIWCLTLKMYGNHVENVVRVKTPWP